MANVPASEVAIHVAVVDDDENIRLSFKDVLQSTPNFNLAGSFSTAAEALDGILKLQPDLVLMDIRLPDLNGIECTKRLRRAMPRLKIIMVTGTHETNLVGASMQAGATAYLIKPVTGDQLLATLRCAVNQTGTEATLPPAKAAGANLPLSPREKEVLASLAEGLLYKEIAEKLGISYATVHKHQHNIFKKLRVSNRSEAARIWLNSRHL